VDDVLRASLAVGSALHALRTGSAIPAIIAVLDQAAAAVRDLPVGPFPDALGGVLHEIERCARSGKRNSARLEIAVHHAVIALSLQTADGT
jgi:hypothetical protein